MSTSWRTVRVFISSTFRDMHSERDWLVKRVFPALRERLEPHRVHLVDVDLRWGVTEQQAEQGGALDVCLQHIDACRPFFLGLLGERYGSIPEKVADSVVRKFDATQSVTSKSITELEILYGVLAKPSMQGHAFFCFRDPSFIADVPKEKRSEVAAENEAAAAKVSALKQAIRESRVPLFDSYPCRYAGLRTDRRLLRQELVSEEDRRFIDEVAAEGLVRAAERRSLPPRLRGILDEFGSVGVEELDEFGRRILEWLWGEIRLELDLPDGPAAPTEVDPLAEERDLHQRFSESRTRIYVGRAELQRRLFAFADGDDRMPCVVTGPSGSGKSAVLAKFALDYAERHPDVVVCAHFVGASPASTSLRQTLRRFCLELKHAFGFVDDVPADTNSLAGMFREFVERAPADRRVLLAIDALNQFDESDNAQRLHWLPLTPQPHVKIVVSCIDEPGREEPAMQAFASRKHVPIEVGALLDEERAQIVREVPLLSAKALGPLQVELLLANPATENPLYLLVALEELRGFGSHKQLDRRIEDFPRGDDAVTDLFLQVIERLETEFAAETVRSTLTLLASARRGLSDRELLDLIEGKEVSIEESVSDLFPVLRQLRPYLQHRGRLLDFFHRNLPKAVRARYLNEDEARIDGHARLAAYFDDQAFFLESPDEQRARAKRLPPTPRPANVRKVDELPWQLLQAAKLSGKDPASSRWDAIADLVTELQFLEAKTEADPDAGGTIYDAVQDFADLLAAMPAEHPRRRLLELLDEGLRRDLLFLERHPTAIFQCLWNSCWWYDSPLAAERYDPPPGGWPSGFAPWDRPALAPLLERWRAEKERSQPDFRWVRSLRPPRDALGSARRLELRGHLGGVSCLALSQDGRRLASSCGSVDFGADQDCRLWDAQRGQPRGRLTTSNTAVTAAAFSPDGQLLATAGGFSGAWVQLWDVATGRQVAILYGTGVGLVDVAFSLDGRRLFAADYRRILAWDVATGEAQDPIDASAREAVALGWGPNGLRIASASPDGRSLWICDAHTGDQVGAPLVRPTAYAVRCSTSFSLDAESLFLAENDRLVRRSVGEGRAMETRGLPLEYVTASAVADNCRRFAVTDGREVVLQEWSSGATTLRFESYGAQCLRFSQLGRRLAVGCYDGSVHIWDVLTGERLHCFEGNEAPITALAFAPLKNQLAVGTERAKLLIWDVESEVRLPSEGNHYAPVTDLRFSPDGERCYSASADWEIHEWDTTRWQELSQIHAHQRSPYRLVPTADGLQLIAGPDRGMPQSNGTVRICDAATGSDLACIRGGASPCTSEAVSSDLRLLATGYADGSLRIDDYASGEPTAALLKPSDSPVLSLAFSVDGERLASGTRDGVVRLWDASRGTEIERFGGDFGSALSLVFSSDGFHLFGGCGDGAVRSWELGRQDDSPKLKDDAGPIARLAVLAESQAVSVEAILRDDELFPDLVSPELTALFPGTNLSLPPDAARLWDIETGRVRSSIPTPQEEITAVACSPEGMRVATGGGDGTVYVWDAASGACLASLQLSSNDAPAFEDGFDSFSSASPSETGGKIRGLSFSQDGRLLVAATSEAWVRTWEWQNGASLGSFWAGPGRIAVCLASDGVSLLTSRVPHQQLFQSDGPVLSRWTFDGELLAELDAPFLPQVGAAIASPDGERAFAVGSQVEGVSTLVAWEIGGAYQCWYGDFEGDPRTARVTGDAKLLSIESVGGSAGAARAGNADLRTFALDVPIGPSAVGEEIGPVTALAFSLDGERLASASEEGDGTVRIWDVQGGALAECVGHVAHPVALHWLPDGERMLSASEEGDVRIWDADSGRETALLRFDGGRLSSIAVSPDGKRIASADESHVVRLLDLDSSGRAGAIELIDDTVESVAFSPDGSRLAGVGPTGGWIWDVRNGNVLVRFALDSGYGYLLGKKAVAFAPEDDRLAVATLGASVPAVYVFSAWTGEALSTFGLMSMQADGFAWSADGRWFVAGSGDRARIFDARYHTYGRRVGSDLVDRDLSVRSVAVSGDASKIAAGREDGSIEVWRPWLPTAERTRVRCPRDGAVFESSGRVACWAAFADAPDLLAENVDGRTWVGAAGRHLYLLRVEGAVPGDEDANDCRPLPTATPTRFYSSESDAWEKDLNVVCPSCGARFAPPQEALRGARRTAVATAAGGPGSTYLAAVETIPCPKCARFFRLSGLMVDNRDVRYTPAPPIVDDEADASPEETAPESWDIDLDD